MIILRFWREIMRMRVSCKIVAEIVALLADMVKPGFLCLN